jgi:hypothetical protein
MRSPGFVALVLDNGKTFILQEPAIIQPVDDHRESRVVVGGLVREHVFDEKRATAILNENFSNCDWRGAFTQGGLVEHHHKALMVL